MSKPNISIEDYEVKDGSKFKLSNYSTKPANLIEDDDSKKIIKENVKELREFQEKIYANQSCSVLLIFQAMDAAGKDSTVERLITGINPQGVQVHSFKAPTPLERRQNFLWRIQMKLPPNGIIGVFNRSHYEEVLITRVHPGFILGQKLPGISSVEDIKDSFWQNRFESIRNFEKHISDNGTIILKFFLMVSKSEQRRRLEKRMNQAHKNWKFNIGDFKERKHWEKYLNCYEEAIRETAAPHAPWHVIPADDKDTMRAIVTEIVQQKLCAIEPDWPESGPDTEEAFILAREILKAEDAKA